MKKTIIGSVGAACALIIMLGMGGNKQEVPATGSQAAQPAMAVFSLQEVYEQSRASQEGVAYLEEFQSKAIARLEEMGNALQAAKESEDEALEQRLQIEMQGYLYSLQGMLNQEQERITDIITTLLQDGVEQYRARQGLQLVFSAESMQAYDPQLDITKDLLTFLDGLEFDYGDMPSLDAPGFSVSPLQDVEASLTEDTQEDAAAAQ